jgi:hypothetical protein
MSVEPSWMSDNVASSKKTKADSYEHRRVQDENAPNSVQFAIVPPLRPLTELSLPPAGWPTPTLLPFPPVTTPLPPNDPSSLDRSTVLRFGETLESLFLIPPPLKDVSTPSFLADRSKLSDAALQEKKLRWDQHVALARQIVASPAPSRPAWCQVLQLAARSVAERTAEVATHAPSLGMYKRANCC